MAGAHRRGAFGTAAAAVALAGAALTVPTLSGASESRPAPVGKRAQIGYEARLNVVFILDGLRPDSIDREETPTLYRLREEGVRFSNSHAAVPSVTRVNSSVIGSGSYPARTGIVGNSIFAPEVNPTTPVSTGEADNLYRLDEASGGRLLFVKTLGERLEAQGRSLVAIGSGTSGGTLLLNPRASRGVGTMINTGDVTPTRPFSLPAAVGEQITRRFGAPPASSPTPEVPGASYKVDYTEAVLRDYVLPELRPDVVLNWLTEPDGTQHEFGAGSPEAKATIRNDDRQIGRVLKKLEELGLADETNVFVLSDHGFSLHDYNVNLARELVDAGLKESLGSTDVVVANTGASLVYVKDRDPGKIRALARYLQRRRWADALYTAAREPSGGEYTEVPAGELRPDGWVEGTFSLELVHHANPERGADLIVTYPWTSRRNPFGVQGTSANAGGGATGPRSGNASGHGSFSPWDIRNTLLAWGPDIKDGAESRLPAGNVDIAPTLLELSGVDDEEADDGRVLVEAFESGPDEEQLETESRIYRTQAGRYRAAVRISTVEGGDTWYVDKSWRVPARR